MKLLPLIIVALILSCTTARKQTSFDYSSNKEIIAEHGVVVCAHPLAAKAGIDVMKKGGNAFDAAITTQFALAVVYPGAGNIGGGGFMVARTKSGELDSLDFRETAPAAAHKNIYLDSAGNVIEGKSTRGPTSSGVPGSVAGIIATLKYATLSLQQLIEPAIALAENGFAITLSEANSLNSLQYEFTKNSSATTAFHRAGGCK